jgi:hypothetical protein
MTMAEWKHLELAEQPISIGRNAYDHAEKEHSEGRRSEAEVQVAVEQRHFEFAARIDRRGILDYSKR